MNKQADVVSSDIAQAIGNLGRLAELFLARREQLARLGGVTVAQWEVLEQINGAAFMPSLFARQRRSTPAAVSKVLRQLLDKNLVRVEVSPQDGRQRNYALTADGQAILDIIQAQRQAAIETVWTDMSSRDIDAFIRFSDELITRLADYAEREQNQE